MFKPLPMKHVLLQVLTDELPQVSLTLARLEVFDPDYRCVAVEQLPTIPGASYRTLFNQALARLDKLRRLVPLVDPIHLDGPRVVEEAELARLNDWLGEVWAVGSAHEEGFRRLADETRSVDQLDTALDSFASLNIDLSLLQGEKHFLNLFIGTIPQENARKLEEALGLANHLLYTFLVKEGIASVIILGARGRGHRETALHAVLQAADFRALPLPPELRHPPERLRDELQARRTALLAQRAQAEAHLGDWADSLRTELENARRVLAMAEPFVRLDTAMRSVGSLAAVTGWVPARELDRLEQVLGTSLSTPFLLTARNPQPEERPLVPSLVRRNRLLAPFATLVQQYGIPRYGEIDPTPLFALTFILMFGMMFGDLGQGILMALGGWLLRHRLRQFSLFAILIGLASAGFGWLYGSLFGYEGIVEPRWIAPLSDPTYMLGVALLWGVGFIVLVSLIAIHNRLIMGQALEALFGHNGLISLSLYLAGLWGLYRMSQGEDFGWAGGGLALGALGALLIYRWRTLAAPFGERLLVVGIETLETLTGYISSSLSFLRVAAFSLNHVALAIAVFTLAGMLDSAGHWLTVLLGNLFILVLEGGIVLIQTLRLEYYEGFSRFYFGDGRAFAPLTLNGQGPP